MTVARKARGIKTNTRDAAIMEFLWRWKVSTTSAIAAKFFPDAQPAVAYNRLNELQRFGYLNLQPLESESRKLVWSLSEKGFRSILGNLPMVHEDAFRSEYPAHDLLVSAVHQGPWLIQKPDDSELFSERELRSCRPEFFPDWVPAFMSRRPDGFWLVPYMGQMRVIALEVERNKKADSKYDVIASIYRDNPGIYRIIWVVSSLTIAQKIQAVFIETAKDHALKHDFIIEKDFEENGWQAVIRFGAEQGRPLSLVLRHFCEQEMSCGCRDIPRSLLSTKISKVVSRLSAASQRSGFPNCIGIHPIQSPLMCSLPNCNPKQRSPHA